jgi:putative DNA primase/helicase
MATHPQDRPNARARQSPYQLVCERLRACGSKGQEKGLHESKWHCPACSDRGFHLSVKEVAGGNVVLHCFHNCSPDKIVAALGLRLANLFAERRDGRGRPEPLTLRAYLQARSLHPAIAEAAGLADGVDEYGRPCLLIPWRDEHGDQVAVHYRYHLGGSRKGRFGWPKGTRAKGLVYGLERRELARTAGFAVLGEGESDGHACWQHDIPYFGFPGASMVSVKRLARDLDGIARLYAVNERDDGAPGFLRALAAVTGLADRVRVLDLSPHKDPGELQCADPVGFTPAMQAAMVAARPLAEVVAELAATGTVGDQARSADAPAAASHKRSDAGNAELLRDLFGDELVFRYGPEDWLHWDGARWRVDETGEAQRLALRAARWRWDQAPAIPDSAQREKEGKWSIASESVTRIEHALKSAARGIEPGLGREADAFNVHRSLLCVPNGIVDLESGARREHDRALLMTKLAGAPYISGARSELWERVVSEILSGDEEVIAFIQRFAGYSATGFVHEQKFLFAHGGGNNGKDVLLNTIRAALGEYGHAGSFSTFTVERAKHGGPREDLCNLLGVRMFTAAETGGSAVFDEAAIKATTSTNPITTEHKFGREFSFAPSHTTWLAANVKPRVKDPTAGFWRRVLLVPFVEDFTGRADLRLEEKLQGELPGVLAWVVRGAVEWARDGLNPPRKVQIATAEYRGREDLIGRFIAERVRRDPEGELGATNLYKAYVAWCDQVGERYPGRQADFGEEMARHSLPSVRATSGQNRGRNVYRGVALDGEAASDQ